jgi:hypothetical protein
MTRKKSVFFPDFPVYRDHSLTASEFAANQYSFPSSGQAETVASTADYNSFRSALPPIRSESGSSASDSMSFSAGSRSFASYSHLPEPHPPETPGPVNYRRHTYNNDPRKPYVYIQTGNQRPHRETWHAFTLPGDHGTPTHKKANIFRSFLGLFKKKQGADRASEPGRTGAFFRSLSFRSRRSQSIPSARSEPSPVRSREPSPGLGRAWTPDHQGSSKPWTFEEEMRARESEEKSPD